MPTEADAISLITKEWKPIPRVSRTIPFGYELDPEDENRLIPNVLQLEALERAKIHLKSFSYREVADWLYLITGRKISYVGLKKRIDVERARRTRATALKNWAKQLKAAEEKVRKFEEEVPGSHT